MILNWNNIPVMSEIVSKIIILIDNHLEIKINTIDSSKQILL